MPLVIVCGRPCTGKTTAAHALCAALARGGLRAQVVSEEQCSGGGAALGDRAAAAASAAAEKVSRARFKSALERALASDGGGGGGGVVVADGCNASKGFRYELSLLARGARTASLCLWVGPDVALGVAQGVNAARCSPADAPPPRPTPYPPAALQDQWQRFEPPDARNRWDSPLLRLPLLALSAPSRARLAAVAADAALQPLPCSAAARGSGGGGDAGADWWAPACAAEQAQLQLAPGAAASAGGSGVPLLTSRFALTQLQASSALALDRGAGAVVEALGAAAQRSLRQAADASAGFGAVPLRGFSVPLRRAGGRAAGAGGGGPDYFAEDFNGDTKEGEEEEEEEEEEEGECGGEGPDIADLRDFEGLEAAAPAPLAAAADAAAAGAPARPGGSFRRAGVPRAEGGGTAAALPEAPLPLPLPLPLPPAAAASAPAPAPAAAGAGSAADALQVVEAWVLRFLTAPSGGRQASAAAALGGDAAGAAEGGGGGSSGSSSSALLHAEAGSAAAVEALEAALRIGGLAQGAFVQVPLARPLLRLARVPALPEVHRLRREWLAALASGSGAEEAAAAFADLPAATRAFVLHVNAALKR